MIYEQLYFYRFGKEISNTLHNINANINNSLISDSITHNKVKGDILIENNKSSNLFNLFNYGFQISDYNLNNSKNILSNENTNNSSYIITKKVINVPSFISKNLFNKNYYFKKEEILTEILIGLKLDEKINLPNYSTNIFKNQDLRSINERNRGVVIQWLSYVNHYFKQSNETLFMCINIMDRFISKRTISLDIYQLVGISSYLIASKYEDIENPSIDELIYISKNVYTHNDIISMEKEILVALNFDIFFVSSYQFFSYFYFISAINNKKLFHLGHLILEICLLNIDIMTYSQSLLAIGALLVAKKCLQIKGSTNNIRLIYNYSEKQIKEIQKKIVLFLCSVVYNKNTNLIMEKFERKRYMSVSYIFKYEKQLRIRDKIAYKENVNYN